MAIFVEVYAATRGSCGTIVLLNLVNMNQAEARARAIEQELRAYVDPVKREYLPRFFKTGKGEYGEGDCFLGVVVSNTRLVAKRHKEEPFEVASGLLQSPWHECRLCALLMLVERFKKADAEERRRIYDFYLSQTAHINNWDLVDLSAPGIVGEYLHGGGSRDVLYRLAASPLLWDQRIAVVSTYTLIKNGDFIDILRLSEYFLHTVLHTPEVSHTNMHTVLHTPETVCKTVCKASRTGNPALHDLMQKAIGWMLREMGKRDRDLLLQFLDRYASVMPRTMLRYAIEKLSEAERQEYMRR